MDVLEFIDQCAGKWFSQRTSHAVPPRELEAGKSDLWIDRLPTDDGATIDRCQSLGISPDEVLCAIRSRWEGTVGTSASPHKGSTMLVFVADGDRANAGKFWQWSQQPNAKPVTGEFVLGADEALTLLARAEGFESEERLWFVSPNLRERTSVVKHANGDSYASFCSEIRMGLSQ